MTSRTSTGSCGRRGSGLSKAPLIGACDLPTPPPSSVEGGGYPPCYYLLLVSLCCRTRPTRWCGLRYDHQGAPVNIILIYRELCCSATASGRYPTP
jgi:hypothetical protein